MKKILFALLLLSSPLSFAQEATGVIKEIKICATGAVNDDFMKVLQFKIGDQWFGTWADHYGRAEGYDDNLSTSLLFMAASQRLSVHVKATSTWHPYHKKCGVTDGKIFFANAGDFIRIIY
ncbi:hypothetical protein [Vibrio caribbeanicus]|uniref:hypothetical protein n=1 Tax=Vibrio caribbeanicus TaxID=701175 RepID=UPI00228439DA|nr:hypothetical protein [Vibrio caribbeanicus]MCY9844196.1 hypothetical protein [Vibrio caribbeanicus]